MGLGLVELGSLPTRLKTITHPLAEARLSDGLIVALASYTMANPGPDDLSPLLSAGGKAVCCT